MNFDTCGGISVGLGLRLDFVFTRRTTRTRLSSIESQPKKVVAVVVVVVVVVFIIIGHKNPTLQFDQN